MKYIIINFKRIIISIFISVSVSLFSFNAPADDIDLMDIEQALGIKVKSECAAPPCPVDVDALLDKLTHEHAKEHKESKLTDTSGAIETSKNSPLMKMGRAELIILNKITAKSVKKSFNLGEIKFIGNRSSEVHKCVNSPYPCNASTRILLTGLVTKIEAERLSIFHGWIVSSNPSISTLEHPVYEIIAVNCTSKDKQQIN